MNLLCAPETVVAPNFCLGLNDPVTNCVENQCRRRGQIKPAHYCRSAVLDSLATNAQDFRDLPVR
jgi:hypothetical protein